MRHDEYKGILNAGKRIFVEEGITGLYRGYLAYILAVRLAYILTIIDYIMDERPTINNRLHDDEHAAVSWRRQRVPWIRTEN